MPIKKRTSSKTAQSKTKKKSYSSLFTPKVSEAKLAVEGDLTLNDKIKSTVEPEFKRLDTADEYVEKVYQSNVGLTKELEDTKSRLEQYILENEELNKKIAELQTENDTLLSTCRLFEEEIKELKMTIKKQSSDKLERVGSDSHNDVSEYTKKIEKLEKENTEYLRKIADMSCTISMLRSDITEMINDVRRSGNKPITVEQSQTPKTKTHNKSEQSNKTKEIQPETTKQESVEEVSRGYESLESETLQTVDSTQQKPKIIVDKHLLEKQIPRRILRPIIKNNGYSSWN